MRRVETLAGEMAPVCLLENMCIDLAFPEDREALALSIIFQTGQIDECLLPGTILGRCDGFYEKGDREL